MSLDPHMSPTIETIITIESMSFWNYRSDELIIILLRLLFPSMLTNYASPTE